MLKLLAGMALGWMAFTDEGRKVAGDLSKKMMHEATKALKDIGIVEDDDTVQKDDKPSADQIP